MHHIRLEREPSFARSTYAPEHLCAHAVAGRFLSVISPRNGSVARLAMAAGAISFAGLMVVEGNPKPDLFGPNNSPLRAARRTAKPAGEIGH